MQDNSKLVSIDPSLLTHVNGGYSLWDQLRGRAPSNPFKERIEPDKVNFWELDCFPVGPKRPRHSQARDCKLVPMR